MHKHVHTQTHTYAHTRALLTFQGVLHVLSEQRPHDLCADLPHVELLREPAADRVTASEAEAELVAVLAR